MIVAEDERVDQHRERADGLAATAGRHRRRRTGPPRRAGLPGSAEEADQQRCRPGRRRGARRPRRASRRSRSGTSGRRPARRRTPAIRPIAIAPSGETERARRGDRDQAGDDAGGGTEAWWACRRGSAPTISQPSMAAQVATIVLMKAKPAMPLAPSAEPALNPNQPNHSRPAPSMHERQVVRAHGLARPAAALAEHDGQRQAGRTGVDVHRGATGEVERGLQVVGDPAADRRRSRRRRRRTPSAPPGSRRSWPRARRTAARRRTSCGRRSRRRSGRR